MKSIEHSNMPTQEEVKIPDRIEAMLPDDSVPDLRKIDGVLFGVSHWMSSETQQPNGESNEQEKHAEIINQIVSALKSDTDLKLVVKFIKAGINIRAEIDKGDWEELRRWIQWHKESAERLVSDEEVSDEIDMFRRHLGNQYTLGQFSNIGGWSAVDTVRNEAAKELYCDVRMQFITYVLASNRDE